MPGIVWLKAKPADLEDRSSQNNPKTRGSLGLSFQTAYLYSRDVQYHVPKHICNQIVDRQNSPSPETILSAWQYPKGWNPSI